MILLELQRFSEEEYLMTKADLIKRVEESTGLKYEDAKKACEVFFQVIQESLLRMEPVRIVNFGKFYIKKTNARKGRNPKTGKSLMLKPRYLVRFKLGRQLKQELINSTPKEQK
ncbi:MAG: HU family DNA-binding protein [Candidatus Hydrogenedentota bacterium]